MAPVIIVLIVVAAVAIILPPVILAPGHVGKKGDAFRGRNIAHRGLFTPDQSIPENSLPAFARAADAGYGVELDVQLSRDGRVVVFHDDTLARICGDERRVDEVDFDELETLRLCNTDERIPLFSEVLDVIGGRVPIIVELKNGHCNAELCEKTLEYLKNYNGETCIESFNPMIVAWFSRHAPKIFRGQLAQPPRFYAEAGMNKATGFILGNLLFNVIARPHFISYRIGKKPAAVRFCEALGAVKVAWTAHDDSAEADFDVVIFEHYEPRQKYK